MTDSDKNDLAQVQAVDDATDGASAESPGGAQNLQGPEADYKARIDEVADLIARVRHEINNPLTGVLGQAQLLLREDLSDTARNRVEKIEQLAIRIRDIVAQLRQVQKT